MCGQCPTLLSTRDAVPPDGDGPRDAEHTADADALVQAVEALVARHVLRVEALQPAQMPMARR